MMKHSARSTSLSISTNVTRHNRVLTILTVCIYLVCLTLLGVMPAHGADTAPSMTVQISDIKPELIKDDTKEISVTVTANNSEPNAIINATMTLLVTTTTTVDRGTIKNWLEDKSARGFGALENVYVGKFPEIAAKSSRSVTVTIPRDKLPFTNSAKWGPYGVQVALTGENQTARAKSLMLLAPNEAFKPCPVAVVAPLNATIEKTSDAKPAQNLTADEHKIANWGLVPISQLAPIFTPATKNADQTAKPKAKPTITPPQISFGAGWFLHIDPALIAANSPLLTGRFTTNANLAQVHTPTKALLESWKTNKTTLIADSWGTPANAITSDPCCTAFAKLSQQLTEQTIKAVGNDLFDDTISVDLGNSALLRQLSAGKQKGQQKIVFRNGSNYPLIHELTYHPSLITNSAIAPRIGATSNKITEDMKVVLTDEEISSHLRRYTANTDSFLHLQIARAFLAMKVLERPNDPRVTAVELPSLTQNPHAYKAGLALLADPWVSPATAATLHEATASTLPRRISKTQDKTFANTKAELTETLANAQILRSLSGKDDRLAERLEHKALWAASTANNDTSRSNELAALHETNVSVKTSVQLITISNINIIANSSHIPVTVKNSLPQPVTVTLHQHMSDARVTTQGPIRVTVPQGSNIAVKIPIKAIGNVTVTTTIRATDSQGNIVASPVVAKLNVQAGLEDIGIQVAAVILGIIFLIGLVFNVVRSKRFQTVKK